MSCYSFLEVAAMSFLLDCGVMWIDWILSLLKVVSHLVSFTFLF